MFDDMLRVQLVLKRICTDEEFKEIKEDIWYDFKKDNNFTELKEAELLTSRLGLLQLVDPYVGRYYSMAWVKKNVLMLDEEEIQEMQVEMDQENAVLAQQQADQQQQQIAQQQQMAAAQNGAQEPMTDERGNPLNPDGTPMLPSKFMVQANELEFM